MAARPRGTRLEVRRRTRDLLSPLNLHLAGLSLLGLVCLYLLVQMAFTWQKAKGQDADAVSRQKLALATADIAARPLQGLDVKLARSNHNSDAFYHERLPVSYSEIASELGNLATAEKVRQSRVQYSQAPVTGDAGQQLTEVRMDASLSGDYRALVHFLNGLERDKVFFLITGVTLTGQQTGTVNLRIRVTTFLRGLRTEEEMQRYAVGVETGATGADAGLDAATARSGSSALGGAR